MLLDKFCNIISKQVKLVHFGSLNLSFELELKPEFLTNMVLTNLVWTYIIVTNMVLKNMVLTDMVRTNMVLTNMVVTNMVLTNIAWQTWSWQSWPWQTRSWTNMVLDKHGLDIKKIARSLGLTFNLVFKSI